MKKLVCTLLFVSVCAISTLFADIILSENFEGNWEDNWMVDSGTWEVGTPIGGPNAAYQGNYCLATILNGYYPPTASTRFISINSITIPQSNQYPRLTFWEWFSFNTHAGYRDHGKVLVRPVGTTDWQQLGSNKIRVSGNVWTYTAYDLAIYAGQQVQIAFLLDIGDTYSYGDEDWGWYIDNIQIKTGQPVFNNPEGWENGIGDWYVDNGQWQVGSSTSLTAYEGNNCLGTVLNNLYSWDAYSRIISPIYTVPVANQYPRLTFWEWFSFNTHAGYRDHGKVLVRPVGSAEWQQLTTNKIASSGGVWTHTAYDLAIFAGQQVQVAFLLDIGDTYSYGDEDWGWYIDNIEIKTGQPMFNNPEIWENGIGDWYVTNGQWQVGTPTSGPGSAYQGTKCAATILGGNYSNYLETKLISPGYQIPADAANIVLRYRHWYNVAGGDTLFTQIKTETETTWHNLATGTYTGNSGGVWVYSYIPIQSYAGQKVQLAFYLDSDGGSAPGWYIDNVLIQYTVSYPAPVALPAINITQSGFTANWNATAGALGYRLDVSSESNFGSFIAGYNNLTVSATSQAITGLNSGSVYYYRIRAVYSEGTSSNSNFIIALTLPPNPVATSATQITAISFIANWSAASSATSYRLDVSLNNSFSSYLPGYQNLTVYDLYHALSNLQPGTYYYYRVRSINGSGASGNSNVIIVRTPPAPPLPPTNIHIEVVANDIHVTWDAVSQTILNTPIVPDYYLVFSSVDPYVEFGYLGAVTGLEYIHIQAAMFGQRMFYEVYAYKYYERDVPNLPVLSIGMSKEEVFRLLSAE